MNRRRFMAAVASATAACPVEAAAQSAVEVEVVRPPDAYSGLLKNIEPGHDEFPLELEVARVSSHLDSLTQTRSLPLASDFQGASPLPSRYKAIAPGVTAAVYDLGDTDFEGGLKRWLDSLGEIRAARFYVLPDGLIRFEIASETRPGVRVSGCPLLAGNFL